MTLQVRSFEDTDLNWT